MGTLRVSESLLERVRAHLFSRPGEHIGFLLASWSTSLGSPVFAAEEALLVPDDQVTFVNGAYELAVDAITGAVNAAAKGGLALVELHNHSGPSPRFSRTDERGFQEFVPYILDSLPNRPYGALVFSEASVHGRWFTREETGSLRSCTSHGKSLRQWISLDDDSVSLDQRFERQLPWFTPQGQKAMSRLRVAIVGLGGTGSHVAQQLVMIGIRDFVLVDSDTVERSNLNRLVTATAADCEISKTSLTRRVLRASAPGVEVAVVDDFLPAADAIDALKGVDVVFGCVDNDGARLALNELSLAYRLPYFDIAVGIDASSGQVAQAGGRVAVVVPGGPCLHCMNEIDVEEARYWLSSAQEQVEARERGYISGLDVPAPAVVSLNGTVASVAVSEFALYATGVRPPSPKTELDLLGVGRGKSSQWLTPTTVERSVGCVQCAASGLGDGADVERYGRGLNDRASSSLNP
ncbi:MAG: ThiF family adenylyltransferase [Dehalococcoidia bacterium]